MSVSRIALAVISERRLPFARPASLLVGDGNHLVQQSSVFRTAEQTQALLEDTGGRVHGRSFVTLEQAGNRPRDEFVDRGDLAGANGVADRLLLVWTERDGHIGSLPCLS